MTTSEAGRILELSPDAVRWLERQGRLLARGRSPGVRERPATWTLGRDGMRQSNDIPARTDPRRMLQEGAAQASWSAQRTGSPLSAVGGTT